MFDSALDFAYIWSGVLGTTPGYQAFGYNSSGYCIPDYTTTVGAVSELVMMRE